MAARPAAVANAAHAGAAAAQGTDWARVTSLLHASRALDDTEETRLLPERKVLYQFSARGHDFAQILLGLQIDDPHDGVTVYYRSRPLMLALGVSLEDAAAGPLARSGSFSGGRDIGVVFNRPGHGAPTVLPACGGVGAQYTPAAG
jgi:2-oxoisovalerate dehydrogenase E1 component